MNKKITGATLFSGFEGVGVGMRAAGIEHRWSIEYDNAIAEVARANGFHTVTADLLDCAPADFEPVDVLHASPPCPNFSVAKAGAEETELDRALADKVAEFIRVLLPPHFTLENVWKYRQSQSWATIRETLHAEGYWLDVAHVNMSEYGVPQSRKRMIVRAVRGGFVPALPPKAPRVIGWYEAIEDLIPTLPESQFAPWQLARLPEAIKKGMNLDDSFFIGGANKSQSFLDFAIENRPTIPGIRTKDEPLNTVPADTATNFAGRAFIVNTQDDHGDAQTYTARDEVEPMPTIAASGHGRYKAFIIPGSNASNNTIRQADEPAATVGDTERVGNVPRAFIAQVQGEGGDLMRKPDEPMQTVTSNHGAGKYRTFIVDGKLNDNSSSVTIRDGHAPAMTVTTSHNNRDVKAHVQGRVVKMTPRALARFQTFPDWYVLPEKNALACRGLGNAVPPLFVEQVYRWLIPELRK